MHQTPRIRNAVRILLVDERDRLFLFQHQDPQNTSSIFWCPVGGGIELGETPEIAIRREVKEETGLVDFTLGPHIWNREVIVSFNGSLVHSKERWYFSRVSSFDVDISGFSEIEHETVLDQKWWTLEELVATSKHLTPKNLPKLLLPLLKGNFPETPLNLIFEES